MMKKLMKPLMVFCMISIMGLAVSPVKAQAFNNGDLVLNAGLGLGYAWSNGSSGSPALSVSLEKGIQNIDNLGILSIGGIAAYKSNSVSGFGYNYSWSDFYLGARAALHFRIVEVDKLDTYAGISLGLRFYSTPVWNINNTQWDKGTGTSVFAGIYGGARYYFSNNWAAFSEIGYDISWLKLGVSYKF
ncbi:MAG: hypothetical protein Q8928_02855 [Bacteroidota bacterium]|nr:hypothetical protein [Bacteroidota bacterium]